MNAATSQSPLAALDDLLDLERSRSFHDGRIALDLSRMEALLRALGPLPRPRVAVHVAGSEGKTSTTELIAAGLSAHGLATGAYTSPHLRDARERLRIDGCFAADAALGAAVRRVLAAARQVSLRPTWFEALTATAAVLFAAERVDAVVWETGLGGRLDATRLLPADVCVITSISLEHTAVLGGTLAAIAAEKAGILRPGAPLVLGPDLPGEARAVLLAAALQLGCPVRTASPGASRSCASATLDALAGLSLVPGRTAAIDAALAAHRVAGRWQRCGQVLFDAAHTVAACRALAGALATEPVAALVFGATSGRDAGAMVQALAPVAGQLVLTRVPGERGVDPDGLFPRAIVQPDPHAALAEARRLAGPEGLVVVTGSVHLVGLLLPDHALPAGARA